MVRRGISLVIVLIALVAMGLVFSSIFHPTHTTLPTVEKTALTSSTSNDTTLTKFKADQASLDDLAGTLLGALNRNARTTCAAIVANSGSHNHAYYLFAKRLTAIEASYGAYRGSVPIIKSALTSDHATLDRVRTTCSGLGYTLGSS